MKAGDKVKILGRERTLVRPMQNIAGGWEVDKPVEGFRYWNADAMAVWRPVSKGLAADLPCESGHDWLKCWRGACYDAKKCISAG
jgi:hypothetical protein